MTRKPRATLSQRREVTRANQPVRERQRQRRAVAHDKAVRNVADPPPPPPPEAQVAMYHFQGNQNNTERRDRQRAPRRGGFEFRFQRPKISERPLLTTKHEASEELTFRSDNVQDKFREVENLSETDDEQMEFSDSEDEAQPSKRIRLEANDSSANAGPRWSNPDPYTSLPPVDDSNRKHKDVVKLIRKARIDGIVGQGAPAATNQDFISFDFDYNEYNDASIAPRPTVGLQSSAPPNAPVGPKADVAMTDGSEVPANAPIRPKADDVTRSGQGTDVYAPTGPKANVTRITGQQMPKQPPAQDNISLGKRKRDDNPRPPRKRKTNSDGMVLVEWQAGANVDSTPWLTGGDDKELEPPGVSLHKEIIDFYEWIRPRDFEHAVRADLVYRLQKAFERIEPGGQLKPFGSFAAGLYLPTGDMDLVYLRRNFSGKSISQNGKIIKPHIGTLSSFATFIANKNIAVPGTVKRIFHAKVPIIKFVESVSGLKVDLSFDNDTGVTANQTFHKWKAQYPAMPILVSIIKHFLMIRGLNDVAFGGLGGFSIICLVTSLVQHFPITSQPPNLGLMLLEFFNLYGNLFNRDEIAIRLDPPGYVQKVREAKSHHSSADNASRQATHILWSTRKSLAVYPLLIHIDQTTTSLPAHLKCKALSVASAMHTKFFRVDLTKS